MSCQEKDCPKCRSEIEAAAHNILVDLHDPRWTPTPTPGIASYVAVPAQRNAFDEYQENAMRTANSNPLAATRRERLLNFSLGLTGEAGEVADLIKKHVYHEHPLDEEKLIKELGDVLWYTAGLAWCIGRTLAEVAAKNVLKLLKRYPNGFDAERSKNRAPGDT